MSDHPKRRRREPTPADLEMRRLSRRSFLWGAAAIAGAIGADRWLSTRRQEAGVPWPFRRAFEVNESLARDYYRTDRPAPTFDPARAEEPFVNGDEGMKDDSFDPAAWKLRLEGFYDAGVPDTGTTVSSADRKSSKNAPGRPPQTKSTQSDAPDDSADSDSSDDAADSGAPHRLITLDDIKRLHYTDMVTEFKCVEGWSKIVHWGGYRLAEFLERYPPSTQSGNAPDVKAHPDDLLPYLAIETPDGGYYVGIETEVALHPQTLLCTTMNGQPLTLDHGGPVRLVTPLKYGIKQIKRIGLIRYTAQRPRDFWAEQGYDFYAGH